MLNEYWKPLSSLLSSCVSLFWEQSSWEKMMMITWVVEIPSTRGIHSLLNKNDTNCIKVKDETNDASPPLSLSLSSYSHPTRVTTNKWSSRQENHDSFSLFSFFKYNWTLFLSVCTFNRHDYHEKKDPSSSPKVKAIKEMFSSRSHLFSFSLRVTLDDFGRKI
jgi:hypothetical protein